jgi:hypothetical protein
MKTSEPQSIGCYELKQHKAFFDEKWSQLLDE